MLNDKNDTADKAENNQERNSIIWPIAPIQNDAGQKITFNCQMGR